MLTHRLIASVDQPVTDYVPELAPAGYDQVTIRHLLQMTSGMDHVEVEGRDTSLHSRFYHTTRLEDEILRLGLAAEPGQAFSYKSGENALLGPILSRALAPASITSYTQERLWDPLGMEHDGAWNLDSAGGLEKTWCCQSATARDYAKLGRLYLLAGNLYLPAQPRPRNGMDEFCPFCSLVHANEPLIVLHLQRPDHLPCTLT